MPKLKTYEQIRFISIIKDLLKNYDNKFIAKLTGYTTQRIYQLKKDLWKNLVDKKK